MSGDRPNEGAEFEGLLDRLADRGPPAIVSALAWSGAMASAVIEMAGSGPGREAGRAARAEFLELGRRDAEVYGRFLVSGGTGKLELLRDAARLPLQVSSLARRVRDEARKDLAADPPLAADLEGAIHLLTTVAVETARVALVNARNGGSPLSELAEEAERILRHEAGIDSDRER